MKITPAKSMSAKAFKSRLNDTWEPLYRAKRGKSSLPEGLIPESMRDLSVGEVLDQSESDSTRFCRAKAELDENKTVEGATRGDEATATDVIQTIYRKSSQHVSLATISAVGFGLSLGASVWGFANLASPGESAIPAAAAFFGMAVSAGAAAGAILSGVEGVQGRKSAERLEQWQAHFAEK